MFLRLLQLNYIRILLLVCLLTYLDHLGLVTIDLLMSENILGYKARTSYFVSNSMYFFASVVVIAFGVSYGWSQILPFFYIALAVFFPMIFLSSYLEIILEMNDELKVYYNEIFCKGVVGVGDLLCGKALAHIVFTRVISALPLLLMTPVLFYIFIKIPYFSLKSMGNKTNE